MPPLPRIHAFLSVGLKIPVTCGYAFFYRLYTLHLVPFGFLGALLFLNSSVVLVFHSLWMVGTLS